MRKTFKFLGKFGKKWILVLRNLFIYIYNIVRLVIGE